MALPIDIAKLLYIFPFIFYMGIKMYELETVREEIGQIFLNLLIILSIIILGLFVVEVVLKCLVINGLF